MKNGLRGKMVVVTRARHQASNLIEAFEKKGAEVIHLPSIEIAEPDSWQSCDEVIANLDSCDWIVFSSTNGVNYFYKRLSEKKAVIAKKTKIAAVGESTAQAVRSVGSLVDLLPAVFQAEGLLEAFAEKNITDKNIVVVSPEKSRPLLIKGLESRGARVRRAVVYQTKPAEIPAVKLKKIRSQKPDFLTFTSPSTFKNFVPLVGKERFQNWLDSGTVIAAIGKITEKAVQEQGFKVNIISRKADVNSFVKTISKYEHVR